MTYNQFSHLPDPSFAPAYVFEPISYNPHFVCQPTQLDFDDADDPLSPVPSTDDHHTHGDGMGGSSKGSKSGGRKKAANPRHVAFFARKHVVFNLPTLVLKLPGVIKTVLLSASFASANNRGSIRDLEARVEILSEGQDAAYSQLRDVIRDLMNENTALRGLLRDVAGFVGEGLGGTLKARTGWDPAKFREFCERGETDTAYEGWLARKRARAGTSGSAPPPGSEHAEDDDQEEGSSTRKRRRSTRKESELTRPFGPSPTTGMGEDGKASSGDSLIRTHIDGLDIDWTNSGLSIPQSNPNARSKKDLERPPSATSSATTHAGPFPDSFPSTFPGASAAYSMQDQRRHSPSSFSAISPQMSSTRTRARPGIDTHADIIPPLPSVSTLGPPPALDVSVGVGVGVNVGQGAASSLFQPGYGVQPQLPAYGASRPMSAAGTHTQPSMYYTMHSGTGAEPQQTMGTSGVGDDYSEADPQLREAGALIKYHIDNYRRNESYHLPPSLRPTLTQRTVQHNGVIDGLIFPTMRDRAILLSGRFDLAECFADLMRAVIIHGEDVLAHSNWELSLSWMKRYHFLVDEPILSESVNPWRRKRGEREISIQDIQPSSTEYSESAK
ncbi:bZIP transcription factor [Ceratobasidium sp. AG-Ba]|nr:bZIP transcription factor [Ceratobasidium sp. AG-Ba]QRW05566.1 bZIP transcription factor [Ceratobasidium sp. AG-Ba]